MTPWLPVVALAKLVCEFACEPDSMSSQLDLLAWYEHDADKRAVLETLCPVAASSWWCRASLPRSYACLTCHRDASTPAARASVAPPFSSGVSEAVACLFGVTGGGGGGGGVGGGSSSSDNNTACRESAWRVLRRQAESIRQQDLDSLRRREEAAAGREKAQRARQEARREQEIAREKARHAREIASQQARQAATVARQAAAAARGAAAAAAAAASASRRRPWSLSYAPQQGTDRVVVDQDDTASKKKARTLGVASHVACPVCTLHNSPSNRVCDVCGNVL